MKKTFTFLLTLMFIGTVNYSVYSQPNSCTPVNTGESATIIIQSNTQLTLDGNPLPFGSQIIAMFNNNGGTPGLTVGDMEYYNGFMKRYLADQKASGKTVYEDDGTEMFFP